MYWNVALTIIVAAVPGWIVTLDVLKWEWYNKCNPTMGVE